ncbi:hypothetical protein KO530_10035 [Aliiglaciecola lipolytica]|nr:hypothetical protein [Aliiglaciecola lipolytica]
MMLWKKKGLIYKPSGEKKWSCSHAQVPVAEFIAEQDKIRIYFSTRDSLGRSLPDYLDVSAFNPQEIIYKNQSPILDLGENGTFDDCGVMPSCVVNSNGKKYLYYIGWNVRNTIPYHNAVGLAISEDDGNTFKKFSEGPLWDRDYKEPHYSGSTCVLIDDNNVWRNWYLSCTEWRRVNGKMEPRYHIKYAESNDGIDWKREGIISIDYADSNEAGIVKASVIKKAGKYCMWYSYRNFSDYRVDPKNSYRIGYAESLDGMHFQRMDSSSGIDISSSGWDDVMICYPHVIDVRDKRLMFYNGNGFGQSGFGYAELL